MLGPFDYAVWLVSFLAEVFVLVWALKRKEFPRYLTLNLYVSGLALSTVVRFVVLTRYGFTSIQYHYCYYYTDALLTVVMFAAVTGLYLHVFRDNEIAKRIRLMAFVVLGTTVVYSFLVVEIKRQLFATHFVIELSEDLYFAGMLLTYILWTLTLMRRDPRLRLVLIVTAFGIYFGGEGLLFALHGFFPRFALWRYLPALLGTWLPLSLAYTFAKVPEESRIPARHLEGAL